MNKKPKQVLCGWFGHRLTETVSNDWVRPMSFTYLHTFKCWCGLMNHSKEILHSKEMD